MLRNPPGILSRQVLTDYYPFDWLSNKEQVECMVGIIAHLSLNETFADYLSGGVLNKINTRTTYIEYDKCFICDMPLRFCQKG